MSDIVLKLREVSPRQAPIYAAEIMKHAAAEIELLRSALQWYEERARLGRMTDDASGDARYEMVQDGGSIARSALNPK